MRVLNQTYNHSLELEERASDPLAGGLMRGEQCGMVWGAALAAGAQAYRLFGTLSQAEKMAMVAAQSIVASFHAQNKHVNCREITGIDVTSPKPRTIVRFLIKSAPTGSCLGMSARYARRAFTEINLALSQGHSETLPAPVSCSSMLAQKMGASDMHVVMAAGLAGGIGLSGGACGALGTALWIRGLHLLKQGGQIIYNAPYVLDTIDRFARCTDNKFECSKIVERKFASVGDHASYVCAGGCAEVIEALAAQNSSERTSWVQG